MSRPVPVVEFVTPPRPLRGGRAQITAWEQELSEALRGRPGCYAVFGRYPAHVLAENVRRRVHRGTGAWPGGRSAWSVVVRKMPDADDWLVYVAFRDDSERVGVA